MDPSHFHKPWIEKLLSTFDPSHQTRQDTRQDSLVGQVLKIEVRFEMVGFVICWDWAIPYNLLDGEGVN